MNNYNFYLNDWDKRSEGAKSKGPSTEPRRAVAAENEKSYTRQKTSKKLKFFTKMLKRLPKIQK